MQHTIGVFDSGLGGASVAKAIEVGLPHDKVIFMSDQENIPYGTKAPELILTFVLPILEDLVTKGCDVIVIACNTVSTTLIDVLRERISVPLIALEPMVKPATEQTKTGVIAVCATPTTLGSKRYAWLKETYAKDVKVVEPDCSTWTSMIETNTVDLELIEKEIEEACQQKADVIVLGCTHYHWIEKEIARIARGRAIVMQPEQSIVKRVSKVLKDL